jgi:hypothetical protein
MDSDRRWYGGNRKKGEKKEKKKQEVKRKDLKVKKSYILYHTGVRVLGC